MATKKIAILGGGNLGVAIAKGMVSAGQVAAVDVIITRRNLSKISSLKKEKFTLTSDNVSAVKSANVIMLCVQPKQLAGVLTEIAPVLSEKKHILVSTITGITTEEIASHLKSQIPIVRAMPNTAVAIGASMTCMCAKDASDKQLKEIESSKKKQKGKQK